MHTFRSPGRLISIEGPNMAGKSTFVPQLARLLESRGHRVLTTVEPGGTAFGAHMRSALKSTEHVCDLARALAMNASRAQKQFEVTGPALRRGDIVLTDRYSTSTRVFQGELGNLTPQEAVLIEGIHGILIQPDLTIYLLPSEALLLKRKGVSARCDEKDVFEKDPLAELRAYEAVLRKEREAGVSVAVLRFDFSSQDSLIAMLDADEAFRSILPESVPPFAKT